MAKNVVFGIDRMRVLPVTAAGVVGTGVDVLGRALAFENESDSEEFEANNEIIDTRYFGLKVSGSGEVASHNPALLAVLGGGTVTTTGVAPNQTFTYAQTTTINPGRIEVRTRSWSGEGTITECQVHYVGTPGPSFDLGTGAYAGVSFDFEGSGAPTTKKLWTVMSYEGTSAASIEFAP